MSQFRSVSLFLVGVFLFVSLLVQSQISQASQPPIQAIDEKHQNNSQQVGLDEEVFLPIIRNNYCVTPFSTYTDDFADSQSGWPVVDGDRTFYRYLDQEYNIYHQNAGRWGAVTRGETWPNGEEVVINGQIVNGRGSWGLLFGLNDNWTDLYTFEVYPSDGIWAVFHFNASQGWSVVAFAESDSAYGGSNYKTEISMHKEGSMMVFKIFGQTMYEMEERPGRIGLTATSFDRFTDTRFDDYQFLNRNCTLTFQSGSTTAVEIMSHMERPSLDTLLQQMEQE